MLQLKCEVLLWPSFARPVPLAQLSMSRPHLLVLRVRLNPTQLRGGSGPEQETNFLTSKFCSCTGCSQQRPSWTSRNSGPAVCVWKIGFWVQSVHRFWNSSVVCFKRPHWSPETSLLSNLQVLLLSLLLVPDST